MLSDEIIMAVQQLRESSPRINLTKQPVMIRNLVWLYQVIVASENLMDAVIQTTDKSSKLHKYMLSHKEEEHGHAEWLAEDLLSAGVDVRRVGLLDSAVSLVGTQYYLIHHVSPVCLLGYMAVLEGFPFPVSACDELEKIYGKPLLRCLRYHAENDPEHRKELFKVIDEINDPLIFDNAVITQKFIDRAFHADH